MALPLVKIQLLVFIWWNKNRSYTEKIKYIYIFFYRKKRCMNALYLPNIYAWLLQNPVVNHARFYMKGNTEITSRMDGTSLSCVIVSSDEIIRLHRCFMVVQNKFWFPTCKTPTTLRLTHWCSQGVEHHTLLILVWLWQSIAKLTRLEHTEQIKYFCL